MAALDTSASLPVTASPISVPGVSAAGKPRVVIVGGGFGGLTAARALKRAPVQVTLVDRQNHHLFQMLLYQVATAGLSPGDIASPIRWILRRQRNVDVLLGDAQSVDTAGRRLRCDFGDLSYDYLIVASGSTHAYFGHDEWQPLAPGLKTLDDALEVRSKVLMAFERAERTSSTDERRRWLTFVIVGAGPTGVELAGALAEIARHSLRREFRRIDPGSTTVLLLEGGPAVLPAFPPELQTRAQWDLQRLGVTVRTNTIVTRIEEGAVFVGDERIEAGTVLWAAGVAASPLGRTLGVPVDRVGRVLVGPDLSIAGHPEVFVIGDLASLAQDGKPLPGVAPVAIQQAHHVVDGIVRDLDHQPRVPFRYHDPGNLATIGRAAAVVDLGWVRFTGWLAWAFWLFVHILKLTGFRNRIVVFVQWAWAYFTYQRSIRLITHRQDEPPVGERTRLRVSWLAPLVVALAILVLVAPTPSAWVERYYASAYQEWQQRLTPLFDGMSWAPFDVWLVAAIVMALVVVMRGWRRGAPRRIRSAARAVGGLLVLASVLYLWFVASWGLNYRREPLTSRLDFDRTRVTFANVQGLAEQTIAELNRLHPLAWAQRWPEWNDVPRLLTPSLASVTSVLRLPGTLYPGRPRPSILQPYFRRAAIEGMTDPFLLDVVVNDDILPIERPAVVAHEWGHLAGLAREAEASYFGWRLCQAGDTRSQYSAWLFVYSHVMGAVPSDVRSTLMARLEPGPRRDLRAIAARYQRVVPAVRDAAWLAYDRYLKSNRVPEGIASYDDVLVLIVGTQLALPRTDQTGTRP